MLMLRSKWESFLRLTLKRLIYDQVNWDFLIECHRARGFSEQRCSWSKNILHNSNVSVKLNNVTRPYF
jgi:hypothetical protein